MKIDDFYVVLLVIYLSAAMEETPGKRTRFDK